MIQVYKPDNTDYDHNGDITLFPTSCELEVELNSTWELTMSHPLDPEGRWEYLEEEAVISAPTFQGEHQLFRISKCEKSDSSVDVTAYPIFFDSQDDWFLLDTRPTTLNGQEALNYIMDGSQYSGESDITTTGTAYFVRRNLIDAINGEDSPTFIEQWGGEILYDNYKVIINERIGGDYGVEIRYGKNMDGLNYTIDMSSVVTRIVPVAYNGRMMSGDEPWVDSENIDNYTKKYIREVEFSNVKLLEDADSDSEDEDVIICEDQDALDEVLRQQCEAMYEAGSDLPDVTIEVSMIDLAKTDQYKDVEDLITVALGDTVRCYNYKLGITTEARVIKLTWDCIKNQPEDMTLGDYDYNYLAEVTSSLTAVQEVIGPGNTLIAERVSGVLNAINTQLKYQKNVAQTADVRAILFEDTVEDSPTYGAMCLGTQGFQIADKRTEDDRDWDWSTAFTAKGGYADTIIAGLLSDASGTSYWNLDTGELQLSGDFLQRSENGELSVTIRGNKTSYYDWEDNGEFTGSVGAVKDLTSNVWGINMWCDSGKRVTIGCAEEDDDTSVFPVFRYDDATPDNTPYIINSASGTMFANNANGGVEIQNGLIKGWDLATTSGTISAISAIALSSGSIASISRINIVVGGGLIQSWSTSTTQYSAEERMTLQDVAPELIVNECETDTETPDTVNKGGKTITYEESLEKYGKEGEENGESD